MRIAEYPRPRHVLAQISDTHMRHPDDPLVRGVVDPRVPLIDLLAGLARSGHDPEALILTGDLSDDGTPESYAELRGLVLPIADLLNARVIWVNGNHDERAAFRVGLMGQPPSDAPINQVHALGGLRVLCLDTNVPGEASGRISDDSLAWLGDQLATAAPEGTLLAMHHAPLPVVQDLAASWELVDQQPLARILAGSDVRLILAGHFHQSSFGTFAGIPVVAATSTCYSQDLFTGRGMRGQAGGQGFNLVTVRESTIMSTVVSTGVHPTVIPYRSAEDSARRLSRRGVTIRE